MRKAKMQVEKAVKHKRACLEAELERRWKVGVPCCGDQFTDAFFCWCQLRV